MKNLWWLVVLILGGIALIGAIAWLLAVPQVMWLVVMLLFAAGYIYELEANK